MEKCWGLVTLTREQVNQYFHSLAVHFEADTDARAAFLNAAEAVLTATLPPATKPAEDSSG